MKKLVSYFLCFIMLIVFASCGNKEIGLEKAKDVAVKDVGVVVSDVEFALNDLITDNNGNYYHLRFTKDGVAYEYKVDAKTGKIISKDKDESAAGEQDDNSTAASTVKSTVSNNTDNSNTDKNNSTSNTQM